jgi:hypothetical protein
VVWSQSVSVPQGAQVCAGVEPTVQAGQAQVVSSVEQVPLRFWQAEAWQLPPTAMVHVPPTQISAVPLWLQSLLTLQAPQTSELEQAWQ